jgi:hypothetical protein
VRTRSCVEESRKQLLVSMVARVVKTLLRRAWRHTVHQVASSSASASDAGAAIVSAAIHTTGRVLNLVFATSDAARRWWSLDTAGASDSLASCLPGACPRCQLCYVLLRRILKHLYPCLRAQVMSPHPQTP